MSNVDEAIALANARELEALRLAAEDVERRREYSHTDYLYDRRQNKYWCVKTSELLDEASVNNSIPREQWTVEAPPEREPGARGRPPKPKAIPPSREIAQVTSGLFVEGATWWPGKPKIISNIYVGANGAEAQDGVRFFNLYRSPSIGAGVAEDAQPWIDHVKRLWPEAVAHEHFFDYCAHMLQHPEIKCNGAMVLSGKQGIGKDIALFPLRQLVGISNVQEIDPDALFSEFKTYLEAVMLVVNEVRASKEEMHASSLYNILKTMAAAPPDWLRVNAKYMQPRHIINVLRVFITTNEKEGMYIPDDDRRLHLMHSPLEPGWHIAEGRATYFEELVAWFEAGGIEDIGAWLMKRDLSAFDPKANFNKTNAHRQIVASWGAPDDAINKALDALGRPVVLFGAELAAAAFDDREEVMAFLRNQRKLAYRMAKEGYVFVAKPDVGVKDRRWVFNGPGKPYRSAAAFVLEAAGLDVEAASQAILERGNAIAETGKPPGPKLVANGAANGPGINPGLSKVGSESSGF